MVYITRVLRHKAFVHVEIFHIPVFLVIYIYIIYILYIYIYTYTRWPNMIVLQLNSLIAGHSPKNIEIKKSTQNI